MKITYYAQSDILYIEFSDGQDGESQNIGAWANLTLAPDGTPRSLEILHAAARGITADTVQTQFVLDETTTTPPLSPEEIVAGRNARAAAIRHKQTE